MDLTLDDLALRAGVPVARIERLVEIGVIAPDAAGRFRPADVQRVEIAGAYERGGISLDDLGGALREGRVSFAYSERIYPEGSVASGRTVADVAGDLRMDPTTIADLFVALGLPFPEADHELREADVAAITRFVTAWGGESMAADARDRAARLVGDAARRATEGWVNLFMEAIGLSIEERAEMRADELRTRLFEPGARVAEAFEPTMIWLLRRHMEHALNALNVESMERVLEHKGVRPTHAHDARSVVFADLTGYTRLTEEGGDAQAARHAAALAEVATGLAARHRGRLVKQLGDGVMLVFGDAGAAVAASADLMGRAGDRGLPPLHIGVSAGPVVERDGDYFGRTVNLAARLSGIAGPGEVIVSGSVADDVDADRLEAIGSRELKGFEAPIPVYRLRLQPRRSGGGPEGHGPAAVEDARRIDLD